jgi:hypothetical protein
LETFCTSTSLAPAPPSSRPSLAKPSPPLCWNLTPLNYVLTSQPFLTLIMPCKYFAKPTLIFNHNHLNIISIYPLAPSQCLIISP